MMSAAEMFPLPNFDSQTNPNSKPPPSAKKRRNLPGTPDPDAEVIALSPKTLMATNRFVCEICNKGFQRDQNLQLHRRGHNLPWKLKQRAKTEVVRKKVYICPEKSCVHHEAARALGDLTGIKKHFSRKHGEKKWKCDKCAKKYAVHSDWKAHSKTCGTREYKCDCGTLFSRKDSFITHRAFCDALAEESARITTAVGGNSLNFGNEMGGGLMNYGGAAAMQHVGGGFRPEFGGNSMMAEQQKPRLSLWLDQANSQLNHMDQSSNLFSNSSTGLSDMIQMATNNLFGSNSPAANYANLSLSPLPPPPQMKEEPVSNKGSTATAAMADSLASLYDSSKPSAMSATALLQKAAQMGSTKSSPAFFGNSVGVMNSSSPSSSSTTNALPFGNNNQPQQQNRSELHQVFGRQQPENPAAVNAMMNFGSGLEHQNVNGGQANSVSLHSGLHGFTRDFLGMGGGGGGGGGPFLPQELAKFASMSSAMGLSHYTGAGNH